MKTFFYKSLFIVFLQVIHSAISFAQQTFHKNYGGAEEEMVYAELDMPDVQITSDSGYIICGSTTSFQGWMHDIYIIKTNLKGDTIWTRVFNDSSNGDESASSIKQTDDGGFIVGGWGSPVSTGGSDAVFLIKLSSVGDIIWNKSFKGYARTEGLMSVVQTSDHGYFITTSLLGSQGLLIKTNEYGDTLWTRVCGNLGEYLSSGVQTSDGGYVAVGRTSDFGSGAEDVFLVKLNPVGALLWVKTFGGTQGDAGLALRECTDSSLIIVGRTVSFGSGMSDIYVIKTNSIGDTLWTRTLGSTEGEKVHNVEQTPDGGFIIIGSTTSFNSNGFMNLYLIKIDNNGHVLWSRIYGNTSNDYAGSVKSTPDGGYIIAGNEQGLGAGITDFALIKTDSNGHSGCYENDVNTIEKSAATMVTTPVNCPFFYGDDIDTSPTYNIKRGGTITTLCSDTINGIEETSSNDFQIYPNPVTSIATIEYQTTHSGKSTVTVENCLGQIIQSKEIINNKKQNIDMSNCASGMYFIKCFDGKQQTVVKIVKN